jgi:prephenate dehydrogenase
MMDKPVKVAIIGGSGKMGQWFARFLLQEGKQVVITGRDPRKLAAAQQALGVKTATNAEAVKWADVVVLSVSIDNVAAVIKEVAPHIKPHQLVIDITSVKEQPVEVMHQYIKTGTVLGVHPMF